MAKKKLGFGLMRLPLVDQNEAADVDIEEMSKMVDTFLERGFTYFDTAWMYCGFKSENATKEALVKRHSRDSFTLADKLHGGFFNTIEEADEIFNQQLEKTGVEFFDYYLLHDVFSGWLIKRKQDLLSILVSHSTIMQSCWTRF